MSYSNFDRKYLNNTPIHLLYLDKKTCCIMMNLQNECRCPNNFNPKKEFLYIILMILEDISSDVVLENTHIYGCNNSNVNERDYNKRFYQELSVKLNQYNFIRNAQGNVELILNGIIETEQNTVAQYRNEAIVTEEGKQIKPIKAFYRVGTTYVSISEYAKECYTFCDFDVAVPLIDIL